MDFGTLLHVAKKNSETEKNESKYYSTKFAPPKKESKEKKLSANIQKFLQKREQEEKERQRVEREKLTNLLSKRDEKSKNKIKKMLKVTKSANKSVLDDAINTEHTAVTMQGPDQPDQDDYGYVSTEANAFYQKYIEKVKDVKEDKGFAPSRPQSLKDLTGTKERVKAAITKEIEEKKNHTRQRTSSSVSIVTSTAAASTIFSKDSDSAASKNLYDPEAERREEERKKREEDQKKAKNRKSLPPPMDFQALLKLAEKKQHEPVEILLEVKKKKEPERLLTLKERREFEERQREREARERRQRERNNEIPKNRNKEQERNERSKESINTGRMEPNGRIPKLNQVSSKPSAPRTSTANTLSSKGSSSATVTSTFGNAQNSNNGFKKPNTPAAFYSSTENVHSHLSSSKPTTKLATISSTNFQKSISAKSGSSSSALSSSSSGISSSSKNPSSNSSKNSQIIKEFPPRDSKATKPRQQPPPDLQKPRQFPPPDVRRGPSNKLSESRKPQPTPKRRILDDDDEDEYDSDLDGFIDDGEEEEDYSSHIKQIFGYDKSRYRDLDDEDDTAMESNFAQVQREEYISKKIGIQEDLDDMKLEAMEKKRKMSIKKRKL